MTRMDSELDKLRRINDALALISEYYISLIDLYRALLQRLDNSVNFLLIRCLSSAHRIVKEQMSIKLLPKSQQAEIMAMVSISKILKTMVDKSIVLNGNTETITKAVLSAKDELHNHQKEIRRINDAA